VGFLSRIEAADVRPPELAASFFWLRTDFRHLRYQP